HRAGRAALDDHRDQRLEPTRRRGPSVAPDLTVEWWLRSDSGHPATGPVGNPLGGGIDQRTITFFVVAAQGQCSNAPFGSARTHQPHVIASSSHPGRTGEPVVSPHVGRTGDG